MRYAASDSHYLHRIDPRYRSAGRWYDAVGSDPREFLDTLADDMRIWDTDSGGTDEYYFKFILDDGSKKFYHITHDYGWVYFGDEIENEFIIEEIKEDECEYTFVGDRDWLYV